MYSVFLENSALDVNTRDTYFVIPNSAITKVFTALYFIVGLIYWLFYYCKVTLQTRLSKLYTTITIGSILIYFIGKFGIELRKESDFPLFDEVLDLNVFIVVVVLIVLATQIILILNIILSLMRHFQSKNRKLN
jgi:cytochrome c oxidase subunit 1